MDGAEGVGNVAEGGDFYPVGPAVGFDGPQKIPIQGGIGEKGDEQEFGAFAGGGLLPGNEVGMVFEGAGENDVSGFEEEFSQGEGGEVQGFGGAPGEDDFSGMGGADEAGDGPAGVFEGFG